jgi:hypothetical protein
MQRFEVEIDHLADGDGLTLFHDCARWYVDLPAPFTLADLVRRAEEHTEVCQ